jgi:glutamyl-tRNA(Gln) amidotransferase subunit E
MGLDYQKIGLKAGLEVHQQLDTGKLFCRCPSLLREDKADIRVKRRLRAVASELGEFDRAALEAAGKEQVFVYEGYKDSTCELEFDECPPREADSEAVETALKVALMLGSQALDEITVMRKAVVDGSNTSGFQRTMLVALGGALELRNKKVGVQSIVLEEDAARPVEKSEGKIVYRVDRLGIPLIELATAPELGTPEEAKECALKIGEVLRRTCKAKRGLGTIRQDLNVSIACGARVEIKGVQALEMIGLYVEREAQRQLALLQLREELKKAAKKTTLAARDISSVFKQTECKFLKGKTVFGAKAAGLAGLLGTELQPGRRFGTELAEHVRAKTGLRGILHSDELPAYGVSKTEVDKVRSALGCGKNDAFILLQATAEKAKKAFGVIQGRIASAQKGIPEETRNALEDGNTAYSRPLPGAARMYPETDLEPIRISPEKLKRIGKELPLSVQERERLYRGKGLSEKLVRKMVLDNKACFFEELLAKGVNATTAATLLLETTVQLKREGIGVSNAMIEGLLLAEKKGTVTREVFTEILREWSSKPEKSLEELLEELNIGASSEKEIRDAIKKIVAENSGLIGEKGTHAIGALMGDAMKQLRGKATGREISRILKAEVQKKISR